jgi:hypothetical protein
MTFTPKFQEEYSAKLPALTLRKQRDSAEVHCNE